MRHIILTFSLICVLNSCQSNKTDKIIPCNQISDSINLKIVNEIIEKDSMFFDTNYPIARKFMTYRLDTTNNDFRIGSPPGTVCIINIRDLNNQLSEFANLNIKDSICIANQIENSVNSNIDITKIAYRSFINTDSLWELNTRPIRMSFYQFYYPLFNNSQTLAYIQYDHICPDECGEGKTMILRKDSCNWKVVYIGGRWKN